jgi:hypothetical protein
MNKYTIEISGRGADCYIHNLTEEQKEKLDMGGVDEDEMEMDEILDVLKKDYVTETDTVVLGVYYEDNLYHVIVTDENNEQVWQSNNNLTIFDEEEDYNIVHDEPNLLVCEDLLKGSFFEYKLDLEEEFDQKKLTVIVSDVAEQIPLITGFRYDGVKLEVDEFGNYWDKGFNFYLT